jgi:hypothetical protein
VQSCAHCIIAGFACLADTSPLNLSAVILENSPVLTIGLALAQRLHRYQAAQRRSINDTYVAQVAALDPSATKVAKARLSPAVTGQCIRRLLSG